MTDHAHELLNRLEAAESARRDDYQNWMTALDRNAELLAKLEAAEKERDEFKRECFGHISDNSLLRAKVEAMEKQEPVASVWRCDNGHIHGSCERTLPMGTKLYALPGAQSAPSAPEGFAIVNAAHFLAVLDREDWRTAKNRAELRAMLAAAPEAKP